MVGNSKVNTGIIRFGEMERGRRGSNSPNEVNKRRPSGDSSCSPHALSPLGVGGECVNNRVTGFLLSGTSIKDVKSGLVVDIV